MRQKITTQYPLRALPAKYFEHAACICKQIRNHLDHNQILTSLNHGFSAGHSCEGQLLVTIHDLMRYRDRRVQADLAILDFSMHLKWSHTTGCGRSSSSMASRVTSLNGYLSFSNLEIRAWWLRDRGQAQYPWTLLSHRVLCLAISRSSCILMTCPPSYRRK